MQLHNGCLCWFSRGIALCSSQQTWYYADDADIHQAAGTLSGPARQGDREAFDRVLAKVPAVPPDPWDRWDGETPSEDEPAEAEPRSRSKTRRS